MSSHSIKDLIVGTRLPATQLYQACGIKPDFTFGELFGYFMASSVSLPVQNTRKWPVSPHQQSTAAWVRADLGQKEVVLSPAKEGQRNQQCFFFLVHHEI